MHPKNIQYFWNCKFEFDHLALHSSKLLRISRSSGIILADSRKSCRASWKSFAWPERPDTAIHETPTVVVGEQMGATYSPSKQGVLGGVHGKFRWWSTCRNQVSCWDTGFCPSLKQTEEHGNRSCFWSIIAGSYGGMQIEVCKSICSQPHWTNHPTTITMRGQERIHRKWLQHTTAKTQEAATNSIWMSLCDREALLSAQVTFVEASQAGKIASSNQPELKFEVDFQPTRFAASLSAKLNPRVAARMQLCVSSRLRKIKLRSFRPRYVQGST